MGRWMMISLFLAGSNPVGGRIAVAELGGRVTRGAGLPVARGIDRGRHRRGRGVGAGRFN